MVIDFRSDNVVGASPKVIEAIVDANDGAVSAYGDDIYTKDLTDRMTALFEKEVVVYPVATGTAANTLSFACTVPPYGAIFCHNEAHVAVDECNGPEFYTGGAKVVGLAGSHGKIQPDQLADAADNIAPHGCHNPQPAAISLTQATEVGTVYKPEEIAALASIAHQRNMIVHIDGARIANAMVYLGRSWADCTWRAGVDVLSFGATKNGVVAAEAVVFFRKELSDRLPFFRKRGGHLFSKMRFLSAQLNAYLENELWRANALHANSMALRLCKGLEVISNVKIVHPVQANGVFAYLPEKLTESLRAEGFAFELWGRPADGVYRLMTAFNTHESSVDRFIEVAQQTCRR